MPNIYKTLTSCDFYPIALALQLRLQNLALIALDFDLIALDRAADAAFLLEHFGQRFQFRGRQRQAPNDGDRLAAAALGFPVQAHNAVAGRRRTRAATDAGGLRSLALGAEAAAVSGVNQAGVCAVTFGHVGSRGLSDAAEYISLRAAFESHASHGPLIKKVPG